MKTLSFGRIAPVIAWLFFINPGTVTAQIQNFEYLAAMASAITEQPSGQAVEVGSNIVLRAFITGTAPLSFQWCKDGTSILVDSRVSGSTTPNLSIANVQPTDAGNYTLVITNAVGSITSQVAMLTVKVVPPMLVTQPQDQTLVGGSYVELSVTASGSPPLRFQWRKDGINLTNINRRIGTNLVDITAISGSESNRLSISSLQTNDAGQYMVIITNAGGAITSQVAVVTVLAPLSMTIQPWSPTTLLTNVGASLSLVSTVSGGGACSYQWRKDGTVIPTATNSILELADLQPTDSGNYAVVVTNAGGYGTAYITLLVGPEPKAPQERTFITLAGPAEAGPGAVDGAGSAARFSYPVGVAVDAAGNVYVADYSNSMIRKIGAGGVVTTVAGLARSSGSADGTGSAARFRSPSGVAVDGVGNLYVADYADHTIRKIGAGGVVTTVAGLAGSSGSADGTGSSARFKNPQGVVVDGAGNVYVADYSNSLIRKIGAGGVVTTVAGLAGTSGSADGTGSAARFNNPQGVAVDGTGNLYVADANNHTVRKIGPGGVVTTVAGLAGSSGNANGTGNAARFRYPRGVAVDGTGNLYVADTDDCTIRKIGADGVVTTVAGSVMNRGSTDGTGSAARFRYPQGVAVDGVGNVYVVDTDNHTVRKIMAGAVVTTVAGLAGSDGSTDGMGGSARFSNPSGVAVDGAGNVYVTDYKNTIRKINPAGVVTTVAGLAGSSGSADGTGSAARFFNPVGVAVDRAGNVYVAENNNHTIRKIAVGGVVTTVAGLAGSSGSTDGMASAARFLFPVSVAVDGVGNLYVADYGNHTIRKIAVGGVVTTVAGLAGSSGSADGAGSAARFNHPSCVAVDGADNVYLADNSNNTIRKMNVSGVVTTVAGMAGSSGSADGIGSAARFYRPNGVAVDGAGNVFVTDLNYMRMIGQGGLVTTVAGSFGSADGTGSAARFYNPIGVAVDAAGNLYVADNGNHRICLAINACADLPTIDFVTGPVGQLRQLDTFPQTATNWQWRLIRRPSGSTAGLSSALVRNPTFTPDVADLYVFQLRATNAVGEISIRNLEFNAATDPTIIQSPTDQLVALGTNVTFQVLASGGVISFIWYKDNAAISGATNAALVLTNIQPSQAGIYSVVVSNAEGSATSAPAVLTVLSPLVITAQPSNQMTGQGYGFTLQVPKGLVFRIDGSLDLRNWVEILSTNTATGTYEFRDIDQLRYDHRFYRAVLFP